MSTYLEWKKRLQSFAGHFGLFLLRYFGAIYQKGLHKNAS